MNLKMLATIGVVVSCLAALVFFNHIKPERFTRDVVLAASEESKKDEAVVEALREANEEVAAMLEEQLGGFTVHEDDQAASSDESASTDLGEAESEGSSQMSERPKQGPEYATLTAPDVFQVKLDCSCGTIIIECHRDWAPKGVDRFYNLVKQEFFDQARFFRVVTKPEPFVVQFGLHADPKITRLWSKANIKDDPVKQSNQEGMVTFAKTQMPNSRSTQIFINYKDNSFLDAQGFAPIGKVIEGMDVAKSIFDGYQLPNPEPNQALVRARGNAYLEQSFPNLDYIKTARIIESEEAEEVKEAEEE